jgi:hypothetical protein
MIGTKARPMARAKQTKSAPSLPAFRIDAEERKFWETHNPAEYLRAARVDVSGALRARVKARKRRTPARTT